MAAFHPAVPPHNIEDVSETTTLLDRPTRGGHQFFYDLTVLQQPERARACGSGSKSAADRRPVDPPPVVQLKVGKGASREDKKDVTMAYNSNFFLYAELSPARPLAHGRVQSASATQPPVLTGMPVSGMAYLDRPTEAGYFLFPDLSVRHEGRYVLAFHLYEEIKNPEDRDINSDPVQDQFPCFHWRMAVKSQPFSVYSAKKFPGLTESTNLSKTISEQGCRVRIRRDVRMRRREGGGKPNGNDYDSNADANEYRNSRRTQTPEIRSNADQIRARSASNSSEHRAAFPPAPERRPSVAESFQPPPPPPPMSSYGAPPPSNSYLRFGADPSSAPYPPHHQPQAVAQPPPISPTTSYHSSQPSPYTQPPSHGYSSRPSSQYAPSNPPPTPHDAYDRRSSAVTVPASPSHYVSRDVEYTRREMDPHAHARRDSLQAYHRPPPLAPLADLHRQSAVQLPPIQTMTGTVGPSHMPSRSGDYIEPGPAQPPTIPETARAGTKRGYGDTFVENHRSLYDGQRPQDSHHQYQPRFPGDLSYKRADGTVGSKLPNNFHQ
ncbi:sexual development activator [Colletotrichum musicola]|uniref:Sexual development activator n=1 Tax=Colletotrichum musicola TaxID=2175873 RepID=A0A8H6K5P6_9PEZI|nr:sexual development activator [Colletotrichum musicola]